MNSDRLYNRVFISYAKENIAHAEGIYSFLEANDFDPWLDKKKLLPGVDWNFAIQDALHKADFIILLLSDVSVSKRGYVQREFRIALDYCQDKLDSDIYVIPVKLNECDVPLKLQKFQWIEYSNPDANQLILQSLSHQRNLLMEDKKKTLVASNRIVETSVKGELGERSPKHTYEFSFPQFSNPIDEDQQELNVELRHSVVKSLFAVRRNYFEYLQEIEPHDEMDWIDTADSTSFGRIQIGFSNHELISLSSYLSEYYTGSMHGMFGTIGINYWLNPLRTFDLFSLIDDKDLFLRKMRDLVHNELMEKARTEYEEDIRDSFYVYDDGLQPIEENFNKYYFTKTEMVFIYNPYDITAWSEGMHLVRINFEELIQAFNHEIRFIEFIVSLKESDS